MLVFSWSDDFDNGWIQVRCVTKPGSLCLVHRDCPRVVRLEVVGQGHLWKTNLDKPLQEMPDKNKLDVNSWRRGIWEDILKMKTYCWERYRGACSKARKKNCCWDQKLQILDLIKSNRILLSKLSLIWSNSIVSNASHAQNKVCVDISDWILQFPRKGSKLAITLLSNFFILANCQL